MRRKATNPDLASAVSAYLSHPKPTPAISNELARVYGHRQFLREMVRQLAQLHETSEEEIVSRDVVGSQAEIGFERSMSLLVDLYDEAKSEDSQAPEYYGFLQRFIARYGLVEVLDALQRIRGAKARRMN